MQNNPNAGKRPIPLAPAPLKSAVPARLPEPQSKIPKILENELSNDSSDGENDESLLVGRTVTPTNPNGGQYYAELDGEDEDDGADMDAEALQEDEFDAADRDELIRARIAAHQEQMKDLLASLTPEQIQRYEAYRRSGLSRPTIKKVMQRVVDNLAVAGGKDRPTVNIMPSTVIAVSGIAKVFVARIVLEEWKDDPYSAITPAHILEAHRRPRDKKIVPHSTVFKRRCRF